MNTVADATLLPPSAPLDPARAGRAGECQLIGDSAAIQELRRQIASYAEAPFPVLIEGESGCGKEIVANCCLHHMTRRAARPYVAVNCAALSPTLVEATLFGSAKGAFTGATVDRAGCFEDADDGTLFLDEIGELPLELQAKLLRVLENGEFQRVGETRTRYGRARVIAATNRDLRNEVRAGRFRADLYHRLSVFRLAMPPLREMGTDRLLLLRHFSRLYAEQLGRAPFRLDAQAEQHWLTYAFPGNVRELRNITIRLTAKHPGECLDSRILAGELDHQADDSTAGRAIELTQVARQNLRHTPRFDLDKTLRCWERAYIEAAYALTHGNLSQAARVLGINRSTLYNRIEALGCKQIPPTEDC